MKLIIAASAFTTLVSANSIWARQDSSFGYDAYFSPGTFGTTTTPENEQLLIDAGRQPNETSSASFYFAPGNLSNSDSNATWTWRVNISEVAVPDDAGSRVVNTQWGLQWPGAGSLHSFVERAGLVGNNHSGLCLAIARFGLPSNITSRYSQSDAGNCSAVVGSECLERFRDAWLSSDCDEAAAFSNLPECMNTLAFPQGMSESSGGMLINSTFGSSIQSGDTIWSHTSFPEPTSNLSMSYVDAETRLNILLVREIPRPRTGTSANNIICQVVNEKASSAAALGGPALVMYGLVLAAAWGLT